MFDLNLFRTVVHRSVNSSTYSKTLSLTSLSGNYHLEYTLFRRCLYLHPSRTSSSTDRTVLCLYKGWQRMAVITVQWPLMCISGTRRPVARRFSEGIPLPRVHDLNTVSKTPDSVHQGPRKILLPSAGELVPVCLAGHRKSPSPNVRFSIMFQPHKFPCIDISKE